MSLLWYLRGTGNLLNKTRIYAPVISQIQHAQFERIKAPRLSCQIDERNKCRKRQLSPHVTIYKFELHMVASLFHRTSGCVLSTFFLVFGIGTLVLPHDLTYYIDWIEEFDIPSWLILGVKAFITLPLCFHAIGGIRHLIWDLGVMLSTMSAVWTIGWASFGIAFALAMALTML